VFDSSKRLRLVDFGSAARMLPAGRDGIQLVPKRQCIVPCGTCDYIAPEILNAHEEALIEIETETQEDTKTYDPSVGGYGKEIDWWSFGAMLYELAFGFPPFYAKDIRKTYTRIVDHNVGVDRGQDWLLMVLVEQPHVSHTQSSLSCMHRSDETVSAYFLTFCVL